MKKKPMVKELEDILDGKGPASKIRTEANGELKVDCVTQKEYDSLVSKNKTLEYRINTYKKLRMSLLLDLQREVCLDV